jgi:replicative DNA helicase
MTETVARTWSPESEQALLGCLLFDGALFDRVGDLVARGDFFDGRNGTIFAAVAALAMSCKPVDPVAVFDVLSETGKAEECGGLSYLLDLVGSSPSLKGVRQYAVRVREKSVQRSLMAAASEAYNIAAEAGELTDKVERIGALFAGIQRQTVRKAPAGMDQLAVRAIDRYTELNEGKLASAVSTGLTDLDRTLNGGLRGGKLYGIAARPSVGKSSVARFIGLSVAGAGVPTLLLSQEMSGDEVADCVVSQLGRVDSERLQTGKLTGDDWGCVTEAIERMTLLPFHVDDQGGLTLNDIRTKARLVKGLGCLILDYLQLTGHTQKGMNRNNQIEEVSRGLKALSLELNIPILVLSQLNRDVEARKDKEPMLSDLRDSGAIEQDLDVAIMLWTVREFGDRRIVGCSVPKHRGGRKGRFALEFRPAVHQWSASEASIDPPTATERRGREL